MLKLWRRLPLIPKLLAINILILAVLHIFSVYLNVNNHVGDWTSEFAKWVDLDTERNIPTLYSSLILGMCAFCCIALSMRKITWMNRFIYYAFGIFFFYVAFDESLIIHETSAAPVRDLLQIGDGNAFYHAWVVPALLVVLILTTAYKFIKRRDLETKFQKRILYMIVLLGAGVIALEVLGTQVYFSQTVYKLGPVMVEELYEISMVSVILSLLSVRLLSTSGK